MLKLEGDPPRKDEWYKHSIRSRVYCLQNEKNRKYERAAVSFLVHHRSLAGCGHQVMPADFLTGISEVVPVAILLFEPCIIFSHVVEFLIIQVFKLVDDNFVYLVQSIRGL